MGARAVLVAMGLIALAACGRGGGSGENLGVASGNSLNQEEIDAALGPANQAEAVNSSVAENDLALANAAANQGNRSEVASRRGAVRKGG
jgi:hypothetical protein